MMTRSDFTTDFTPHFQLDLYYYYGTDSKEALSNCLLSITILFLSVADSIASI